MNNFLVKIDEALSMIRKNIKLFVLFILFGLITAIASHHLIKNRYEGQVYIKVNYPQFNNDKLDLWINNEIKILLLQAKDKIFYTEKMNAYCGVENYNEFLANLKISEVRGINSVLQIKFISNDINNSKKCIRLVIDRIEELIKIKTEKNKERLIFENSSIQKNINILLSELIKDKNSNQILLEYFMNKSKIDSLYDEYRLNKEYINELSKITKITQLSEITAHSKPIYINELILYLGILGIYLSFAIFIATVREIKILNKQQ